MASGAIYPTASSAAGFAVYRCTVGRLVSRISESVVRILKTVVHAVLIRPMKAAAAWLGKLLGWLYRHSIHVLLAAMDEKRKVRYLKYAEKRLAGDIRLDQF